MIAGVLPVRVDEFNDRSERSAASASDFDVAACTPQRYRLALQLGVELNHVDAGDAVLEEPVCLTIDQYSSSPPSFGTVTVSAVPEPSTAAMIAIAGLALLVRPRTSGSRSPLP